MKPHHRWRMDLRLAARASDFIHRYGSSRGAWAAAGWSLLFSGLGQYAGGQRARGIGWAGIAGGLFATAVWIHSVDLLLVALFAGLLAGPFLVLFPLALAGVAPAPLSAVFWFGALAKLVCVGDAWLAGRTRPLRPVRRALPVFIVLQVLPALWFCQAFFVLELSGPSHATFTQPGDVILGVRRGAWLPWEVPSVDTHGSLVGLFTSEGGRVMRVVGLPGERVQVSVDERGRLGYFTDRPASAPEVARRDEFCVWTLPDGSAQRCVFHEERRGGGGRPYWIATVEDGPEQEYRELVFQVAPGELFLLSDLRQVVLQSAWLRVRASDVAGTPLVILWSRHPTRGVAWHRIGLTGG